MEKPEHVSVNPYVFVVGCVRSGTTLLQRMIDAHPQLAVTPEHDWIPRSPGQGLDFQSDGPPIAAIIGWIVEQDQFDQFGISRDDIEEILASNPSATYSMFISRLFDFYGSQRGKRLVGGKNPRHMLDMPVLHALFPPARFIHVVRDGRDFCLAVRDRTRFSGAISRRHVTWAEDPVSTAALMWAWLVRRARADGLALGPDLYYEVRYESLVASPGEECARLCAFLGLPYDDAMLRYHEGKTLSTAPHDTNEAWLPVTPGLRDWRSQMSVEDVERFEAAAGELLDELGYPRAIPLPRPELVRHAARLRAVFQNEVTEAGIA